MLTTIDGDTIRARPMQIVQSEYDGTLWFFTDKTNHKTDEIEQESSVGITFSNPESEVYISISGRAKVTQDKELIDKFWNSFVAAWFPDGKDSPKVALLEIKIDQGEHWDTTSSFIGHLFEISKAKITGSKPDMGENQKFN